MEGKILAGRYRLLSKLGEGGMGSVWRAEHLSLKTPLAIKLIDPSIAESDEALARFRHEAQSAAELRSVHVVQIIDYGVDDVLPFIAMELLEGESLDARLARLGRLSPAETAAILTQVARALARAHAAGIVHRDLKPENIHLIPEGDAEVVKVLDFGIAKKLVADPAVQAIKTGTGTMMGTPYYMSPEQVLGRGTMDHRIDIWSFGIIAFQSLTGALPFTGDTLGALFVAICGDPMPVPSTFAQVPLGFDEWFARCSARTPAQRFASALEAAAALNSICGATLGWSATEVPSSGKLMTFASTRNDAAAMAVTALEFRQTAMPSSITIGGRRRRSLRGMVVGIGIAVGVAGVGWVALSARSHRADSRDPTSSLAQVALVAAPHDASSVVPSSVIMPAAEVAPEPPAPEPVSQPARAGVATTLTAGANSPGVATSATPVSVPTPHPAQSLVPAQPRRTANKTPTVAKKVPAKSKTKPDYDKAVGI
jgi:serine/threonine-protein kinase